MITLRKAKIADAEEIYFLINKYAGEGLMLPRSRNMIYENIRDFLVAQKDGEIVGTGSLHIVWHDLAEIRALAIKDGMTMQGIGKKLVDAFIIEARELGLPTLFTLTYQPGFFAKNNFKIINKDEMPQKVWKECVNCPKFPNCDEIAMVLKL